MTVLQFIDYIWHAFIIIWAIGILCWTIIAANFIKSIYAHKKAKGKAKGKEGQIIHPQKKGVGSFQHLYSYPGLPQNHRHPRDWTLRHL